MVFSSSVIHISTSVCVESTPRPGRCAPECPQCCSLSLPSLCCLDFIYPTVSVCYFSETRILPKSVIHVDQWSAACRKVSRVSSGPWFLICSSLWCPLIRDPFQRPVVFSSFRPLGTAASTLVFERSTLPQSYRARKNLIFQTQKLWPRNAKQLVTNGAQQRLLPPQSACRFPVYNLSPYACKLQVAPLPLKKPQLHRNPL